MLPNLNISFQEFKELVKSKAKDCKNDEFTIQITDCPANRNKVGQLIQGQQDLLMFQGENEFELTIISY